MDVSESGVRLQGVQVLYRAGQTAVLEHNGNKAQYRVVWVGGGALAGQAGLMNLEPQKSIFNLRFPASGPDKYVVPPPEVQEFQGGFRQFDDGLRRLVEQRRRAEKRKDERRRYPTLCRAAATRKSTSRGLGSSPRAASSPTSAAGAVSSSCCRALTLDTKVTLVLLISQRKIRVEGVVRSVLTNFGLGIQFLHFEPEDLQRWRKSWPRSNRAQCHSSSPNPGSARGSAPHYTDEHRSRREELVRRSRLAAGIPALLKKIGGSKRPASTLSSGLIKPRYHDGGSMLLFLLFISYRGGSFVVFHVSSFAIHILLILALVWLVLHWWAWDAR